MCQFLFKIKSRSSRTRTIFKQESLLYRKPYKVGKKSYSYKLSTLFHKSRLKVDYIEDIKLINKIYKNEIKLASIIENGTYKFLNKFFDKTKLSIDIENALKLSESRYKVHKDYIIYLIEANQILDLHNGIYKISYNSDTDRRIHTNITSLPKVYRKFITYDFKPLVEVDISNSILYFLSMFITVINKQDTANSIYNYIYYNKESNLPLMLGKYFKTISYKEI